MSTFNNTNGQPNIGPIVPKMYPTQFSGDTFYYVSSASSSTKLVFNAWSGASDDAWGMELTFNTGSGGKYIIHVNAGNDNTYNPDSVSVGGSTAAGTAICDHGDTVTIYDSNGNYGEFNLPTFTLNTGPVVTWTQPTQTNANARDLTFQFTPTTMGTHEVIDTANNNHVHAQINYPTSAVNVQQTSTFKIHTDVGFNPVFQLRQYQGTHIGAPYTPSSAAYPGPKITASWSVLDTSVTGGKVTLSLPTTTTHQENIYYNSTNGDEIEVSDSLGNSLWTGRFGVDFPNTSNSIDVSPVFQSTEIGTTKTLKLRIKNTTYEDSAFHDLINNAGYNHTSGSYSSPYQPQFSISNPVWAQQVGNIISVNWTETNGPPATGVELWKTNGSSAISSSTTGGPLSYTLQSQSDNGTYELKYLGFTVNGSTSNSYAYQTPGGSVGVNYTNIQWNDTFATGGTTVEVQFNYTNSTSANKYAYLYIYHHGATNGIPGSSQNVLLAPSTSGTATRTITLATASANTQYWLSDDHNGHANYASTHTTGSPPAAGSVTVTGYNTNSWSETGGGAPNNTVTVTFTVNNTTSSSETFFLRKGPTGTGPHWVDQVTCQSNATTSVTLTNANAGQSELYRVYNSNVGYLSPTFTTAPTPTQQPSVSYAPAKGGRKRRFPIISTQLFNRQRSVYSIGKTHHETSPQF